MGVITAAVPATTALSASIQNTASIHYTIDGGARTVASNTVSIANVIAKQPTSLSFHSLPNGYKLQNMACQTSPTVQFTSSPVSASEMAAAPALASLDVTNPLIVELVDPGDNRDPNVRETELITVNSNGHISKLVLLETAPDSGIFAGGVPAGGDADPAIAACDPTLIRNGTITLSFTEDGYSYGSSTSVLIDPTGYVFDSRTGALLNGAVVTILDATTGLPAKVTAQDGHSDYPSTVTTGQTVTDSSGHQYVLPTGNFRFPLLPTGQYQLKIQPPKGYTAPSVVKPDDIAKLTGPYSSPFIIVDASYGASFPLTGPAPLQVDIPVDTVQAGTLILDKIASLQDASPGDIIQYQLTLTNKATVSVNDAVITDILPMGLRYKLGSARGVSTTIAQPTVSADGHQLTFIVPTLSAGAEAQISYVTDVAPGAPVGNAVNRASAVGSSGITSNAATASVRIKPLLFTDDLTIIGRVTEGDCHAPDKGRIGVPGIRLMMEDGTLVTTDRDGLYHFEGAKPGTHVVQLDTNSIPATLEPVACDNGTRQAGNPISRFVEAGGGALQRVDFQLRRTGKTDDLANTLPISVVDDTEAAGNRPDWLAKATPGIDWMFPLADHNPRAPALRVVIRHLPGQRIALTVNGEQVDPLSYDGTDTDDQRGVAVSRWVGLPLRDRDNELDARVLDKNGHVVATLRRVVHYANAAKSVVYVPEKSRLDADGLVHPLIAVRVLDRDGLPVRAGSVIPFHVDQPYTAAQTVQAEQGRQLSGLDKAAATARVVGDEGLAFIALEPTTHAGEVHVTVTLRDDNKDQTTDFKAWLTATQKDWQVVGFGKGTFGYSMLKKHAQAVIPGGGAGVTTDAQLALYAKGRIKGKWLLTLAYNTDKKYDPDRGLLGQIDPDKYYTVYGDGAQQTYDAATKHKLYLRLERRDFYALYGDFQTGMTDTKLSRYSRTLNGAKAQYQGNVLMFTAFAANDDQLYGRDEIKGNGLSGPYRLSATSIIANSDQVSIETRDRFRSEKIISTVSMTRHIDYDIDADSGTIRFREPVLSRDPDLNPIFIVVDYETYGTSRKFDAGGRVAAKLAKGRIIVGASAIHDESVAKATVVGVDLKIRVNKTTEFRAEAATGGVEGVTKGRAYDAELEHHDSRIDVLGYVQRQDDNFGVGQQNFAEAGTQKIGIDGRFRISNRLNFVGSGWYQNDLDGSAERYATDLKLEYRRDKGTVFVGTQIISDHTIGDAKTDSRLISVGASQQLFNNRVTVTGQTQFAIGGQDASIDFPVRRTLDVAWRLKPGIKLIAGEEIATGSQYTAHSTRIGFEVAPWTGAKLLSTMNQQGMGENGQRTFAQYGLNQSLPLGHGWTIDATVDANSTIKGHINQTDLVSPFQPVASGTTIAGQDQEDGSYKAITGGATYRSPLLTWNGRLEYRISSLSKRWGVTSNLLRSLGEGMTLASSIRVYQVHTNDGGGKVSFASADLAFAYRPLDSHWSLLERLELRQEGATGDATGSNVLAVPTFAAGDDTTMRVVNDVSVNYRSGNEGGGHGFEASLYYGAKYIRGRYSDDVYQGFIDVIGVEVHKDVGQHLDVGGSASMQHAWTDRALNFSIGPSVGASPGKNIWLTVGYNVTGYRDHDYQATHYTRQGPYVTMRLKFDQLSLGGAFAALKGAGR